LLWPILTVAIEMNNTSQTIKARQELLALLALLAVTHLKNVGNINLSIINITVIICTCDKSSSKHLQKRQATNNNARLAAGASLK